MEKQKEFESSIIEHKIENGVEYIQFKKLLEYPTIKHAYILKSFQQDFRMGEEYKNIENVKKQLEEISKVVGIDYERIVRPDFEHTNRVAIVSEVDESEIPNLKKKRFPETDGLITKKENIALIATNADCNLVLIYDPIQKVIANIHARLEGDVW